MKYHQHILALLAVASTLLSSCTLLVSSPIPHSGHHHHYDDDGGSSYRARPRRVYSRVFQVPAEGGIYEFDCATDQFYISKIYDTSMPTLEPMPRYNTHTNCRISPSTDDYESVNDLTYNGSFYTITCDMDKQNWVITVDPFVAFPDEPSIRDIWVLMHDESDDSGFVFQFEQIDDETIESIQ